MKKEHTHDECKWYNDGLCLRHAPCGAEKIGSDCINYAIWPRVHFNGVACGDFEQEQELK